ncbi:MAG TPA: glycosyltransferase [Candidatus Dormibacteraeota bacterium]|nr:glycosyltransferase [Candidatus Dormibacteraeota bacterium]
MIESARTRRSAAGAPVLAVVIPTRERVAQVTRLLAALEAQQGLAPGSCEVVVVVDGSSDGTAGALASLTFKFPLTTLELRHSGPGTARNTGWTHTQAPLVLFLDDDLLPNPRLLAQHISAHREHPNAVVLGHISPDRTERPDAWTLYDQATMEDRYAALGRKEVPSGIHVGGNFSVQRRHLDQVGGFDDHLLVSEHIDLGFRLAQVGLKFVYAPSAEAVHCGRRSYEKWCLRHRIQGRMDVALYRDRGYAGGLQSLVACYHDRKLLTRLAVRLALTRKGLESAVVGSSGWMARTAHALGLEPVAKAALSATANTIYWGGVRDGLRGNTAFWRLVRRTRSHNGRPYLRFPTRRLN